MQVVLWDTRRRGVTKDFAGGFGVGEYHGRGGLNGRFIRHMYRRDRRPAAMNFAYLAAVFRQLGHGVEYCVDGPPNAADLYVFNPSLITLGVELDAMRQLRARRPAAKILVTGLVAYTLPEAFAELDVTLVRGEPEQLLWKLDEVLHAETKCVDVGSVADLDSLPWPDWSIFDWKRFRVVYDFWKFPTALVQASRGCTLKCNYCPYIILENSTRFRDPELVVAEIEHGMRHYGFRSFKFRDPLFGLDRKRVLELAERLGRLPRKVQFSVESRIDLLRPETLRLLRDVGLTSVTVGIETPDEATLRTYKRAPIKDDRQREFVATCRRLGIRTAAGFMIGFPADTRASIRAVLKYAKRVNPTYANFNIVTPYPGTEFFAQVRDQIASLDFSQYTVYQPVLKYQHLSPEEVLDLHARCFRGFYFRSRYLRDNAPLVWPWLRHLGWGRKARKASASQSAEFGSGAAAEAPPGGLTVIPVQPAISDSKAASRPRPAA